MHRLLDRPGWTNRCDTYDTYYKTINDFEVIVSKHISKTKWSCTLVQWLDSKDSDEIVIREDCTFEWIVYLTNLLEK